MEKELIFALFVKFENACYYYNEIECWSAREIQEILGYSKWYNFLKVIDKAKKACENSGEKPSDHFADVGKMVFLGSSSQRAITDFALSRYACYLIAQNGESSKNEVASAQTYFAVQTRKQEIIEQHFIELARVTAREKLSKSEHKLSGIIYERGVEQKGFANIRNKGDQALFGGFSTNEMKQKLNIPGNRPLADFLPTLTIKAKDFAIELTSHNVIDKELNGEIKISDEHIENNKAVRKMLGNRGVKPEELPSAEDVKKVQRRINSQQQSVLNDVKKGRNPREII